MTPSAPDANGYVTYTATPAEAKWSKTGSTPFPNDGSTPLIKSALGPNAGTTSLQALIDAYPEACIYNFPHPAGGVTPAVVFNLGDSGTITDKKYWLRDIGIGSKTVF